MQVVSKRKIVNKGLIASCIIAGILLLISNSSIWINRQIFDSKAFTYTAVNSITSQSSRDAIANKITDEALKDYPRIQNVVDDTLIKLISGLLDGDRFQATLSKGVSKLQVYLTSSNQQDVVINLAGTKDLISRLAEVSGRENGAGNMQQRLENIPNQIVLIEEKNIPDLYNYGVAVTFLAPFTFLAAVILLAYPYFRNQKHYLYIMVSEGLAIVLVGLMALLLGLLLRPIVLGPIQDPNSRVVAGNLYDNFVITFNKQTLILITIGSVFCAAALVIKLVNIYSKRAES